MLSYETIFSRVRGKIDDPKELSLEENASNEIYEIYVERLHMVIGNPRVRRLFSSITLDDEIMQITYELNNSVDEFSDDEFVTDIFTLGMVIEWLQPKVDSLLYTISMLGTKEEKMLLNERKNNIDRLESMKNELNKKIRDYGYIYNSYVNGN